MRRFLDTSDFGIDTWPSNYKDDFTPLIERCIYNKGSLMQTSLDCTPTTPGTNDGVEPLPPLLDSALEPHQKESLAMTARAIHSDVPNIDKIEVLTVFLKCGAIKVGGILIGSEKGKPELCRYLDGPQLARVHYFAKCSYVVKSPNNCSTHSSWFALVSFFQMHQCHVWYGHPTQVWTRVTSMDSYYLPVSHLQSKVAYCSASIHFGRIIGTDTVYVVVPV